MHSHRTAVLLCGLLIAGISLAISVGLDNRYTSSATLAVGPSLLTEDTLTSVDIDPHYVSTKDLRTDAATMPRGWLRTVAARASHRLRRTSRRLFTSEVGARKAANDVDVIGNPATNTLTVQAAAADPTAAAELANAFAEEYVSFDREAYFTDLEAAEASNRLRRRIERADDRRRSRPSEALRRQAELLDTLAAVGPRPITLLERARPPTERSSPNPLRNAAVGLAVGLLAGIALFQIRWRPAPMILGGDGTGVPRGS